MFVVTSLGNIITINTSKMGRVGGMGVWMMGRF